MSPKKPTKRSPVESCEAILAVLKAGQRQLEYLAHEHLDFRQVLRLEQNIRVGSSPERAEIQRMRLLLDARLDHISQMRALSSLAPLTLTPMDEKRFERVSSVTRLVAPETPEPSTAADKPEALPEAGPRQDPETLAESLTVPEEEQPSAPEDPLKTSLEPATEYSDTETLSSSEAPSIVPTDAPMDVPTGAPDSIPSPEPQALDGEKTESEVAESNVEPPSQATDTSASVTDESASGEDSINSPEPIALGGSPTSLESKSGLSIEIRPASTSADPEGIVAAPAAQPLEESLQALMTLAGKAHAEGELERAIEAYSDLLDQTDAHLPALLARGRCLLEAKDYAASLSDFRRAQQSFQTHPAPLVALGDLFMARKEHAKAIEFFDKAIALKPDHPQARCRRGLAHYHCGRYRQAFLDLQRAYKLDPEIPNIRRLVQMAIRKLEDSD